MHYSIVAPSEAKGKRDASPIQTTVLNTVVPGIRSAKMMHDFGVSSRHTIIMDLPLSLDPLNLAKNKAVVAYDPTQPSRFGVFPRYEPARVRWFETNACCIFHTANSWDSNYKSSGYGRQECIAVNMLACRLTSAALVFSAGDLAAPVVTHRLPARYQEKEQCRLYYYQFLLSPNLEEVRLHDEKTPIHQWALSAIPFEFPSLRDSVSMSAAKYIYGCSVSGSSFGAALGRAVKINSLVKIDVETLIERGRKNPPTPITGCVDMRSVGEIVQSDDCKDPIKIFMMPPGWYAQESRFVPRKHGISEDDGWLLSYVFDESQLDEDGECRLDANSELWIIEALNMTDVIAKIRLPQRVPYGLHGNWFSEEDIQNQRPVKGLRTLPRVEGNTAYSSPVWKLWMRLRSALETWLA